MVDYPFENACFISYRSGQEPLTTDFIEDLKDGLAGELEARVGRKVFVDKARLEGGDLFNQELATALCQSACMILVFTPPYFSLERTYPAREYKAMLDLEEKRRSLLGNFNHKGLVIPVVFRGFGDLPDEIKAERHCHDFQPMTLSGSRLSDHPDFGTKMDEIASYVKDRCAELAAIPQAFDACGGFQFPTAETIRPWLEQVVAPPSVFPQASVGVRGA